LSLAFCKKAVFVSIADKEWVLNNIPSQKGKLHYIPNGVDVHLFFPDNVVGKRDEKTVLFVGNYTWKKGNRFLKSILSEIYKDDPSVRFLLVGLGISTEKREQISNGFKTNQVEFLDHLSLQDMAALYRKATVLICTSIFEGGGFSLTLMEAMQSGLPIVSFSYPGLSQVLKSGTEAILVKSGDWLELAKQVISLLKNPDERKKISAAGREKVKEYTWPAQIEKWENLLTN
jgi:phosphatidylinositol alpha-mannosyltransferase